MKKHIFIIGMNDKVTKKQELSKKFFIENIYNTVGDCTIYEGLGYYTHEDGTPVKEKSLKVEMLFKEDKDIPKYAEHLKTIFNQESIVYEYQEVNSVLL